MVSPSLLIAVENTLKFPAYVERLTLKENDDLVLLVHSFSDIFTEIPGRTHLVTHVIKLVPGALSIKRAPYRLSPDKNKWLAAELNYLLQLGIISEELIVLSVPL